MKRHLVDYLKHLSIFVLFNQPVKPLPAHVLTHTFALVSVDLCPICVDLQCLWSDLRSDLQRRERLEWIMIMKRGERGQGGEYWVPGLPVAADDGRTVLGRRRSPNHTRSCDAAHPTRRSWMRREGCRAGKQMLILAPPAWKPLWIWGGGRGPTPRRHHCGLHRTWNADPRRRPRLAVDPASSHRTCACAGSCTRPA